MASNQETEMIEVLEDVKPIDISPLLENANDNNKDLIYKTGYALRESFEKYGVVIIKDPRVTFEKNEEFLNMIEDYFNQPTEIKNKDIRPELSFQIGATPSLQETARNHCKRIKNMYDNNNNNVKKAEIETLDPKHKPWTPCPPEADPKWRYFWRLGSQGVDTQNHNDEKIDTNTKDYVMLNATNVVPKGIDNWSQLCDEWGTGLLNAARTIAKGISIGYNLKDENYFVSRMIDAPHLLAPTATDLNKFGEYGTIIAGYHYDLNFITVHGKSRYPGLSIFLRNGEKVRVKVPNGCLLAQAGKQLEYITGGKIYAGFHEVCVNEATVNTIDNVKKLNELNKKNNQRIQPLWRISSTLFSHINSKVILQPINNEDCNDTNISFSNNEYPPIQTQDQVVAELKAIGLHKDASNNKGKVEENEQKIELLDRINNLIELVEAMPSN